MQVITCKLQEPYLPRCKTNPNWFAPHDRYRRILPVPGRAREGLFTVATADIQVEAATARIRFEACFRETKALPAIGPRA